MEFKGGVIIIGSLIWDTNPKRDKWRQSCLKSLENKVAVSIRIRYGRESRTRNFTYTMILSNHPSTEFGEAIILPFRDEIKAVAYLEDQAFALANAEGLWAKEVPALNKSWGTVGLLINPDIDIRDKENADTIRQRWIKLYNELEFDNADYLIGNELPIIDKDGFLQIEWTKEMAAFDFLIATPVVPNPRRLLSPKEVAHRMMKNGYTKYFFLNRKHEIKTFQDDEILKEMK